MSFTKVIAISGASGAGKTTVVKQLAKDFNSPFLLFDDFTDKESYPDNMKKWLSDGADLSLIETPRFVSALQQAISASITPYIFVEEPFGKERQAMSPLIDYVVLLDLPLEICLLRIIKRHTEQRNLNTINSISIYLDKYEDHFRDIYKETVRQVRSNSDLIIDERTSLIDITTVIGHWLESN
ncbi:MAG: hypothetical protein HRT53_18945 [Colwellia sp.]|nr:hypothetical protein [Colwellia sp.]